MADYGYQLALIIPTYNECSNIDRLLELTQQALPDSINWELIVVDDNSSDGTADYLETLHRQYTNIRCLKRIGRRGLSSACLEGILATNAPIVAVMDADMQHDECLLPLMYQQLAEHSELDMVVGSRYMENASTGTLTENRVILSKLSNWIGNKLIKTKLSDPMSGFFMLRRGIVLKQYSKLSRLGFKLLLDIYTSYPTINCIELPYIMRSRFDGESKLDILVSWEYIQLLLDKTLGKWIPLGFISFVMVGFSGLIVHLVLLYSLLFFSGFVFSEAQLIATLVAIANNFYWNNFFTYRAQRLEGRKFWQGMLTFYLACTIGVAINVNIASMLKESGLIWWLSGGLRSSNRRGMEFCNLALFYLVVRIVNWENCFQ